MNPNIKMPKMPQKNMCETCNFICYKKSNYDKHLTTRKHKNLTNPNNLGIEVEEKIICNKCNKIYKHASTLSAHKKKCVVKNDDENTDYKDYKINLLIKENTDFKNIILDMIKNNTESQKQSNEIQEKMIEVYKTNNSSNNIITNNNTDNTMNNSNNKTFNLQVFLNEQCKDAMNLSDFMESIQLNLTDLENMEKLGYTECMFKNIVGHMDFIDIFSRPLHCSDLKRGIIYIKENGIWEKEDAGHSKLINAIRIVEKKNFNLLKEWSKKYPSFSDSNSPYNDKYVKIFGETMNGDKDNLNKVIRKLAKSCVIDKGSL